ncbi:hypothetical protein ZWY2020_031909 [Hordeum vulgare]|nr:hypothetical protein ZWY2020_031909 [Hordeum vulgare]
MSFAALPLRPCRSVHPPPSVRAPLCRESSMWSRGRDDLFSRSRSSWDEDDKEALRLAALEKLPTYDRTRMAVLAMPEGEMKEVNADKLGAQQRIGSIGVDHEWFLSKFKDLVHRAWIELPTIEVHLDGSFLRAYTPCAASLRRISSAARLGSSPSRQDLATATTTTHSHQQNPASSGAALCAHELLTVRASLPSGQILRSCPPPPARNPIPMARVSGRASPARLLRPHDI